MCLHWVSHGVARREPSPSGDVCVAMLRHAVWAMMAGFAGWCEESAELKPDTVCSGTVTSDECRCGAAGQHSFLLCRLRDHAADSRGSSMVPHRPY